jgi:hypothetical protein
MRTHPLAGVTSELQGHVDRSTSVVLYRTLWVGQLDQAVARLAGWQPAEAAVVPGMLVVALLMRRGTCVWF